MHVRRGVMRGSPMERSWTCFSAYADEPMPRRLVESRTLRPFERRESRLDVRWADGGLARLQVSDFNEAVWCMNRESNPHPPLGFAGAFGCFGGCREAAAALRSFSSAGILRRRIPPKSSLTIQGPKSQECVSRSRIVGACARRTRSNGSTPSYTAPHTRCDAVSERGFAPPPHLGDGRRDQRRLGDRTRVLEPGERVTSPAQPLLQKMSCFI
jgi:hypothetical protein